MSPRPARLPKVRPPDPTSTASPWRLFVAVPLPASVRRLVGALVGDLAGEGWPVRWVAPEGAHLTLHFLGETEPERAELLRLALGSVVARHAAFELRTGGLGVFPSPRRPRVIWLGLDGPGDLLAGLHRDIGEVLRGLGFQTETGRLRPHLTLGRVRAADDPTTPSFDLPAAIQRRLEETGRTAAPPPDAMLVPVREVELVRSFLGKGGARYEVVGRYPLASTPGHRA